MVVWTVERVTKRKPGRYIWAIFKTQKDANDWCDKYQDLHDSVTISSWFVHDSEDLNS